MLKPSKTRETGGQGREPSEAAYKEAMKRFESDPMDFGGAQGRKTGARRELEEARVKAAQAAQRGEKR